MDPDETNNGDGDLEKDSPLPDPPSSLVAMLIWPLLAVLIWFLLAVLSAFVLLLLNLNTSASLIIGGIGTAVIMVACKSSIAKMIDGWTGKEQPPPNPSVDTSTSHLLAEGADQQTFNPTGNDGRGDDEETARIPYPATADIERYELYVNSLTPDQAEAEYARKALVELRRQELRAETNRSKAEQPHKRYHKQVGKNDDPMYYCERRHLLELWSRIWIPVITASLMTALWTGTIVGYLRQPYPFDNDFALGATSISGLAFLVCAFWGYRGYYYWHELILEVDTGIIKLHKPESRWLFLTSESTETPSFKMTIVAHKQKLFEMILFRNSRTLTLDTESHRDEDLHDMKHVRDWKRLGDVVEEINRASNIY